MDFDSLKKKGVYPWVLCRNYNLDENCIQFPHFTGNKIKRVVDQVETVKSLHV